MAGVKTKIIEVDGTDLAERIRERIKKEARDYDCLRVLQNTNPKLAELCMSIDNIITKWACDLMEKTREENKDFFDTKK